MGRYLSSDLCSSITSSSVLTPRVGVASAPADRWSLHHSHILENTYLHFHLTVTTKHTTIFPLSLDSSMDRRIHLFHYFSSSSTTTTTHLENHRWINSFCRILSVDSLTLPPTQSISSTVSSNDLFFLWE